MVIGGSMKLYVNEKLFSIHDRFFITDEEGNNLYEITSKLLTIGDKMTIKDMAGNEVAYIEQELFHLMRHYNIYFHGELACQIQKKFKLFKHDYELNNGYRIDGNFMALDFDVYEENNKIAHIGRKFFTIGDKYEIEIFDDSKLEIILAIMAAITKDINNNQAVNVAGSSN